MVGRRVHAFVDTTGQLAEHAFRKQVDDALQRLARLIAANTTADGALSNRVTELESAPSSSYTDEQARDAIGTALVPGHGLDITVNDPADTITIDVDETELDLQAASYVTLTTTSALPSERVLTAGHGIDLVDGGAGSTITVDVDESELDLQAPSYVTLATTGSLPNERVLTAGHGVDLTDAGAGSTITVDVDETELDADLFSRWVSVREIDFANWAATEFSDDADGTTTVLDGGDGNLTWTTQSAANANAGSSTNGGFFRRNDSDSGDDSAHGLRIFHDASISTSIIRGTQTGPRLTVPLNTLIPNYSPLIDYRIELVINRFSDSSAGTVPTGLTATMGVYQAAGTPTGSAARFNGVGMQRNGANIGAPTVVSGNGTFLPITASTHTYASGTSRVHNMIAIHVGPQLCTLAYGGDMGGSWPADTALRALGGTSEVLDNGAVSVMADENNILEIGVASRSSATGSVDVMFRRLRVLRRIR